VGNLPKRHPSHAPKKPRKPGKTGQSGEKIGCGIGKLRLRENRRCQAVWRGIPLEEARRALAALLLEVVPFDEEMAALAASIGDSVRGKGLTPGDRACLAMGLKTRLPVLTAESSLMELDARIKIELIR
jgi:hypothetical protein